MNKESAPSVPGISAGAFRASMSSGAFNYVTTTADNQFGQLSKDAIREKISKRKCDGAEGSCAVVWGPTDGLRTDMAEMVLDSISAANNTIANSFVQKSSFARDIERALSELGSPVEIPSLDMFVTGGIANFSAKNCTECSCQGKVESNQPFIEWKVPETT